MVTVQTLMDFLGREPFIQGFFKKQSYSALERVLTPSAQVVSGQSGLEEFSSAEKVLASDNPTIAECVCLYGAYLLSTSTPGFEVSLDAQGVYGYKKTFHGLTRVTVIEEIQNRLAMADLRDVSKWIEEAEDE